MDSKRSGREDGSSSRPASKKKSIRNHNIEFKDVEQRNRYKVLISKPMTACRYPDDTTLENLGISDSVFKLLNRLGLVDLLRPMRGFKNFTYEFLSSISFTKDRSRLENPDHRVSFQLLNIDYEMSVENFCNEMGFANAGYIHDSWNHDLRSATYDAEAFWTSITGIAQYNSRSNKASNIHNPVLRYLQWVMACTIWGRKEVGPTRTDELFMLWAMLYDHPVNTCYYLLEHLSSIGVIAIFGCQVIN